MIEEPILVEVPHNSARLYQLIPEGTHASICSKAARNVKLTFNLDIYERHNMSVTYVETQAPESNGSGPRHACISMLL